MSTSAPYTTSFLSRQEVAKDTYTFYFKRPDGFVFIPGQYNRWTLLIEASDGRGNSRFFTISSSPDDIEHLSITTKIIQSDFKKALLQLKEGDEIKLFGPMGDFVFDSSDQSPKVFMAGGIGITPFHSMLTTASVQKSSFPLTLFVSFSTPEEMVFYDELQAVAKDHDQIKIIYTITHPEKSQTSWAGETGRISPEMIKKYVTDIESHTFYVSGPPAMVAGMKKLLTDMQLAEEKIHTEDFTGY